MQKDPAGNSAPTGGFKDLGWYSGFQFFKGSFAPQKGVIHPSSPQAGAGQPVSPEVRAQSAAAQGVSVQQFESFLSKNNEIEASNIQAPAMVSLPSGPSATTNVVSGLSAEAEKARRALEENLGAKKLEIDTRLTKLREEERAILAEAKPLTTPFRADLEEAERERLFVNKNFEENQKLVDELDSLLTEGNDLIRQMQDVTGLGAIRNPRIQQTMSDVAARAGVIEAVINARNGQIAQAFTMIDRSVNAINADRKDQLAYYDTVLSLYNRDIISLDTESKDIAEKQIALLTNDLDRANETVDYVKKLMINPETAQLVGEAGVTLNDSVEQINVKLGNAQYNREVRDMSNEMAKSGYTAVVDPTSVPANQLITVADSKGNKQYFRKQVSETSADTVQTFIDSLTEKIDTSGSEISTLWGGDKAKSKGPQFTPQAQNTTWQDPQTGELWIFTAKGWVKL